MALSKSWTLQDSEEFLRNLFNEIAPDKVQSLSMKDFINLSVAKVAEMINGASQPDYGTTQELADASSSLQTSLVSDASYTNTTRTVTKAAHGFTSADVGRRIAVWNASRAVIAQIESITDSSNFVITYAFGLNASPVSYAVFSAFAGTSLDLTALKVDKVISLVDSVNGLVLPANDFEFRGLSSNSRKQNNCWYNHFGETLRLYKGSNVSAWGTLTLEFYRQPTPVSATSDYLDIKDKYVSLVLLDCENYVYKQLNKPVPQQVTESISAEIRRLNLEEQALIKDKKK